MDTQYNYDGKQWIPNLTVGDNNSFFHSIFGTKTTEYEAYFDKHANFRRMRWSTFLTYFQNETMSPYLADVLQQCLSVNGQYKSISTKNKTLFATYVSDIISGSHPVAIEEIPVLSALENVKVVVLSDKEPEPVIVCKPNPEILGTYTQLLETPKEVVLRLNGNIFSRLSPIDENSVLNVGSNGGIMKNNTMKGNEKPQSHLIKYKKGGSAGSKGVEFQVYLLTIFLLNALQKLKNWRLSTENTQAGKFDDIVLELSDESVILLQAKHKENKKITFDQLISVNSKNHDFSLPKYFFSYQEIKRKFNVKAVIICTNTYVDKKSLKFLNRQTVTSESMLHYEDGSCSFFTVSEKILPYLRENIKIYYENNLQDKNIDDTIISDENIKDFLKNLQLYTSYPPGNNLGQVVEKLLFHMKSSNNLWDRTSSQDIYIKITEWFKQPHGEYLTESRAKSIFSEIRSDKYCETLEHYNILFEHNDSFTDPKRLYQVSVEDGYLLPLIKIYRALRNNKSKILFVNPDDFLDVQKYIIDSFELPSYTFLVIVWTKIIEEFLGMGICAQLGKILEKFKYKKIILVSQSHYKLCQRIGLNYNNCSNIKEPVTFQDFTKDSQAMLLNKKSIIFQGYVVSLAELCPEKIEENFQKALCPKVLENIVRNEKIKVGSELQPLDDNVARFYIDRQLKRRAKTRDEIFCVETILEVNEKVVIISDSAGMGKSTVLTKLALVIKKNNPHMWVIRVALNDYTGILKDYLRNNKDTIDIVELLDYKNSTKLTNYLEKFVFSMRKKVVVMLDGVDEISPDYTELIVSLIIQCQEAPNIAKVFVTTRPHMSQELQTNFQSKPFIFQPFTRQDQVDFLTGYWMLNLRLDNTKKIKCEQYADALISKMSAWIRLYHQTERHFAAIPLQVRMLAEIFQENNHLEELTDWDGCKEYLLTDKTEPNLPANMNITKLYQIFIEKKRDIFIDKENPIGNISANQALTAQFEECLAYHRALALKFILEGNSKLFSCYQDCGENIELNVLKIGIVQKLDNTYYFVHRTFAEYFVAECLLKELRSQNKNVLFQHFFIDEILTSPEYNVIRAFFDRCLSTVLDSLPSHIFENYQFLMYEINMSRKRKFNLFHQLAAEGCASVLQLLYRCVNYKITTDKRTGTLRCYETNFVLENQNKCFGNPLYILRSLIEEDGINFKDESGRTLLHYAAQNGHLELVEFLIEQNAHVDVKDSAGFVPLREAVKGGHFEVAKFLIEQGADTRTSDRLGHTILYEAIVGDHVSIARYILETILKSDSVNTDDIMIPYTAAYLGHINVIRVLLKQGGNVNSRIGNDESLIFGATRGRQLDTIQYLLEEGADINSKDDDGNTPLILATFKGHVETVKFLVKCGADIDVGDNDGRTPLHTAASWGRLDAVEFLVDSGADINIRDNDGYTALYLAAEEGLLDIVKFLVDHGAYVNIKGNDHRTALFLAAVQGELDTIKFLVGRGANVNFRDNDGCTALFLAAENGWLDIVKYLVKCDADINMKDEEGRTALHIAVLSFRHLDSVKFLVECGADLNSRDNNGCTALLLAAMGGNLDIIKFLVEFGANVNVRDSCGSTALLLATHWRQPDTIKFLVECGTDINAKGYDGWTALHLASVWGKLDIIKFLVEQGANINIVGKDGRTALLLAVKYGHLDVVMFFIVELGMNINIIDNIGRTALHYAAYSGVEDVVKFLIQYGADINIQDFKGNTAAMSAKRKGHMHVFKYLETKQIKSVWTRVLCTNCLKSKR